MNTPRQTTCKPKTTLFGAIAGSIAEAFWQDVPDTIEAEIRETIEQELIAAQRLRDVEARHATARASLGAAEQMLLDLGLEAATPVLRAAAAGQLDDGLEEAAIEGLRFVSRVRKHQPARKVRVVGDGEHPYWT